MWRTRGIRINRRPSPRSSVSAARSLNEPGGPAVPVGIVKRNTDYAWGYAEECERIPFRTFRDNIELYEQALSEDSWISTKTRLYWANPGAEANHLAACKVADDQWIAAMRPSAFYRAAAGMSTGWRCSGRPTPKAVVHYSCLSQRKGTYWVCPGGAVCRM